MKKVNIKMRATLSLFATTALSVAFAPSVFANDTDVSASAETANASEIVVTARGREERLQTVPLAINVLSGDQLRDQGVKSLADLATVTPGLTFQDLNGAYAAPTLRGVAQVDQMGPQGNVGVFIDGVYLNNRSALAFDQYEIGRIEVVKGPQSASYGRNTFAGAINYVTVAPSIDKVAGYAQATLGNYGRHEGKASINLPISENMAVRVFGGYSEFGGTILNERSGKRLDGWNDRWSAGASFMALLSDQWTLNLYGVHSETANDQPALASLPVSANNCGGTSIVNGNPINTFLCGTVKAPKTVNLNDTIGYGLTGESNIVYGKLAFDGDTVNLLGVVSYTEGKYGMLFDTSGDPSLINVPLNGTLSRQLFTNSATEASSDWNFGLEASSATQGPLSWKVGMNHFRSSVSDGLTLGFQPLGEPNALPEVFSSRGGTLKTTGFGVYGSLGYEFSPQFNVLAELRYSVDDQTYIGRGSVAAARGKQSFSYASPRFSANWKPNDDLLVYATAARGLKTGGFNSNAANTSFFSYGAETNWTYEAGVKSTLLGGRLIANLNGFYVDWRDLQAQTQMPFSTLSVVANNGDASVKGIEGQLVYNFTRNLQLSVNGALMDPKYKGGMMDGEVAFICGEIPGSTVITSDCTSNVAGNQIARTSDKQAAVAGSWTIPDLFSDTDGFIRADYSWQSSKYSTALNVQRQGAISLLNARAGLRWNGVEFAIWAKNLLQERYLSRATVVASTADGGPLSGASYTRIYPGERRTFGADVSYRF